MLLTTLYAILVSVVYFKGERCADLLPALKGEGSCEGGSQVPLIYSVTSVTWGAFGVIRGAPSEAE
jgi:hypothetical protein